MHDAVWPSVALKKLVGDNVQITEDDLKSAEQEIQKMTDLFIKKVDEMLAAKERDIMEV